MNLFAIVASCLIQGADPLIVRLVDVEGGGGTLVITPARESILIDCGNPGARDAGRIAKAIKEEGLTRLDHLVITHWHLDHYGGAEPLAAQVPIGQFWDRGIPASLDEDKGNFPTLIGAYKRASKGASRTLKPGDTIPLKQAGGAAPLSMTCVCASGDVIKAREGLGPNGKAGETRPMPDDPTDNAKSLGFVISLGKWRYMNLGDLTWNMESRLVFPVNRLGEVDVYHSTHHGLPISNNPAVIRSVRPTVAVFNNGARKGGSPEVLATLRRIDANKGIFQVHRNETANSAENTEPDKIANQNAECQAYGIRLEVKADGVSYSVKLTGAGKTWDYQTRVDKEP
jgi:beta-lactamase superfamily II metal-dependent hydrolase